MKITSLAIRLLGSLGAFVSSLRAAPPSKILFVGDSITHHSPAPEKLGWTGNWGMAASGESQDYVHRFLHRLEQETGQSPSVTIEAEGGGTLAGKKEALGRITALQADLAVVQMGENDHVVTPAAFQQPYGDILAAIRRGNAQARIFCFGVWSPPKGEPAKDALIRALCVQYGATFVDLSGVNANLDNQVKAEKRFTHAGVNWHPGDQGMKAYAEALWLAFAAGSPGTALATPVQPKVPDQLSYPSANHARLGGRLGQAIALSIHHRILVQSVDEFIQPMKDRKDTVEWRSEFWGKWITSAILAYTQQPEPALRAKITDAVAQLIATQTPEGYIGSHSAENHLQRWDIWGRKYCLLGLLAWYDASGDTAALRAAQREADFMLTEVGPGKGDMFRNDMWHGVGCSSVLEPMVVLYRRTGERRYLDFCEWLVREWEQPYGPDLERKALADVPVFQMFPGPKPVLKDYHDGGESKAYEMMSCFEGLVELYRTTGETRHLEAAQKVWENIRRTEITVIGSGSDWERWCNGAARQTEPWTAGMETCVTATWIKLSAQLLRATGDSRYADAIELAAYNALLGAQAPDGAWWVHYVTLTGKKDDVDGQCGLDENCCVVNGPRALMLLPDLAVMRGPEGPVINLYGTSTTSLGLASGRAVKVELNSDYPAAGQVTCRITPTAPDQFTVKLRIPAWSRGARVSINGRPQAGIVAGTYAAFSRRWSPGDTLQVEFPLPIRAIPAPGNPRYFALARGPIILARDKRLDAKIDRPLAGSIDGIRPLAIAATPEFWMRFAAADGSAFCDFASAGDTWRPDSRYRIWFQAPKPAAPKAG